MKDLIWFDFGSSYFQIPLALTRTAQRDSNVWKAHGPHSPPDISTNHCHPCQNGPLYQPHKQRAHPENRTQVGPFTHLGCRPCTSSLFHLQTKPNFVHPPQISVPSNGWEPTTTLSSRPLDMPPTSMAICRPRFHLRNRPIVARSTVDISPRDRKE